MTRLGTLRDLFPEKLIPRDIAVAKIEFNLQQAHSFAYGLQ